MQRECFYLLFRHSFDSDVADVPILKQCLVFAWASYCHTAYLNCNARISLVILLDDQRKLAGFRKVCFHIEPV